MEKRFKDFIKSKFESKKKVKGKWVYKYKDTENKGKKKEIDKYTGNFQIKVETDIDHNIKVKGMTIEQARKKTLGYIKRSMKQSFGEFEGSDKEMAERVVDEIIRKKRYK